MNKLLSRVRYVLVSLMFAGTMTATSLTPVFAATNPPITWTGQGTTDEGNLKSVDCTGDTATPGTLLWVFSLGGNNSVTSASLTLGGSGTGTFAMSATGNNMKAVTPMYDLSTLTASASYVGTLGTGNSNLVISHGCPNTTTEVPTQAPVVKDDECGTDNDTYTVPAVTGIVYKVGETVVSGVESTNGALSVTVKAYPASADYTLTGQTEWTLNFTNETCEQPPVDVTLCHATASRNNPYEKITVDAAGAYNGHYTQHTGAPFNGTQKSGDKWGDIIPTFTYDGNSYSLNYDAAGMATFRNNCNVTVPPLEAEPAAVTFTDICATVNDTYTIPSTTGVVYKVNGVVTPTGTYPATGAVNVTAEALNSDYELSGTLTWSHNFTNEACGGSGGFVLGDTFTPTPVAAQPQVLADTGASSVTSTLVAVFVLITALAVYAFNPKFETR